MATIARLPAILIRAMRPKQWVKNGFVVMPALFARELDNWASVLVVLGAVACFCLTSSAVYLVNDVLDRKEDRVHPRKRLRPVASGELPVPIALGAAGLLFAISGGAGLALDPLFAAVLGAYAAVSLSYTLYFKHEVILDVMFIAAGFVLRVVAGAAAIRTEPSVWILICTGLLALMLGFGKRRGEVIGLAEKGTSHRRVLGDYSVPFLDAMLLLSAGITLASYAIYTATDTPAEHHLAVTLPVVLYGMIRYLWLAIYRDMSESPTNLIWTDRPLQITVLVWAVLSAVMLAI